MKKSAIWTSLFSLCLIFQTTLPVLAADDKDPDSFEPDSSLIDSSRPDTSEARESADTASDESVTPEHPDSMQTAQSKIVQEDAPVSSDESAAQENSSPEKHILEGTVVNSANLPETAADYLIVPADGSNQEPVDSSLLESIATQTKPAVFQYEWTDTGTSASMEAYRFFSLIRDFPDDGILLVRINSITPGTGPKYVRAMLDALFALSGVRPVVTLGEQALARGCWTCLDGVYSVWGNPLMFEGTLDELKELGRPDKRPEAGSMLDRLYNPNSGEHFYTMDRKERDYLITEGWQYEGAGWSVPQEGEDVWRVYNPNAGDHHYTLDERERSVLIELGWKDEGVAWKASSDLSNPVYRAYNPNAKAGSHHFSINQQEIEYLASVGWHNEGIAWHAGEPLVPSFEFPSETYQIEDRAYNSNCVQVDGIQSIHSKLYYFNPDRNGCLETRQGLQILSDGSRILVEDQGVLASGLRKVDQSVFFFDSKTGKAQTDRWHLMDGSYDHGRVSFMLFDSQGAGKIENAPTLVEKAYLVRKAGICSLVDPETGIQIPFRDYIRAHYGNARLNSFLDEALKYEGWPYVWAGKDPKYGFDCSGLMTWTMRKQWGVNVNPIMTNAAMLYATYCDPISQSQTVPGDLVFWKWTYGQSKNYITHTAIYCGNGWTYQAGDPIGFYTVDASRNVAGQPAEAVFGRPKQ